MENKDQKLVELEKQVQQLLRKTSELNNKILYLERENVRRKNEINQLIRKIQHAN